jgi:hypothetical protein
LFTKEDKWLNKTSQTPNPFENVKQDQVIKVTILAFANGSCGKVQLIP